MKYTKLIASAMALSLSAATLLSGCGIDKDAEFATMNGKTVNLGLANFVARFEQASMDEMGFYISYAGEGYWSQDFAGDGSTLADNIKTSVADALQEQYLLDLHAEDFGIALTDEDNAKIDEAAKAFMAANDEKSLKELGATEDIVKEYLRLTTVSTFVKAAIRDQAEIKTTEKDNIQKGITVVEVDTTTTDSEGASIELSEDEINDIRASLTYIAGAEDFDDAVTTAGYESSYKTYDEESTAVSDEIKAAADSLSEGEVSDIIETEGKLSIVRFDTKNDKDATQSAYEAAVDSEKEEHYNEVLEGYKAETPWTLNEKNWAKVKIGRTLFKAPEATEEIEEATEETEEVSEEATEETTEETTENATSAN